MTTPLSEAKLKEIEERAAKATPAGQLALSRYDHGGGRLAAPQDWLTNDNAKRVLVADFYSEGDREFYANAAADIPVLLAELQRLRKGLEEIEREYSMSDPEASFAEIAGKMHGRVQELLDAK